MRLEMNGDVTQRRSNDVLSRLNGFDFDLHPDDLVRDRNSKQPRIILFLEYCNITVFWL